MSKLVRAMSFLFKPDLMKIELDTTFPITVTTSRRVHTFHNEKRQCCCQRGCVGCKAIEIKAGGTFILEGIPVPKNPILTQLVQTRINDQTILVPSYWFDAGFDQNIFSIKN